MYKPGFKNMLMYWSSWEPGFSLLEKEVINKKWEKDGEIDKSINI